MNDNVFGYMDYNPNETHTGIPGNLPYAISPLDIQICYKKLFDIYCGAFLEKRGELITLLRLYNGDYRRVVLSFESVNATKETEKMDEIFKARLEE